MAFQSTVITTQPQVSVSQYTVSDWTTNLGDCCDDCGICMCATCVPCILACRVAQDHGESCCLPCLPGAMVALRTSMRHKYRIEGSVCNDSMVMTCCALCGLCQMAREQKTRE
ncbi:cornifelin homolog [Gouania willdenowi]|uniref:Cornifelin homolog n=1 Tax=Gouania willdenowi TaxID=441366 RepID=A0A8C5ECW0_GOUWI|nr:cornifelin homolog [Gouania willdenowi]